MNILKKSTIAVVCAGAIVLNAVAVVELLRSLGVPYVWRLLLEFIEGGVFGYLVITPLLFDNFREKHSDISPQS
jgi:hypothetical protein